MRCSFLNRASRSTTRSVTSSPVVLSDATTPRSRSWPRTALRRSAAMRNVSVAMVRSPSLPSPVSEAFSMYSPRASEMTC